MVFLVSEEAFAVAVVVLEKKKLVVTREDSIVEFRYDVVIMIPTFTFYECYSATETPVLRVETGTDLIYATIIEDITVFRAVDYGDPKFTVNHYLRVDHDASAQAKTIPRP